MLKAYFSVELNRSRRKKSERVNSTFWLNTSNQSSYSRSTPVEGSVKDPAKSSRPLVAKRGRRDFVAASLGSKENSSASGSLKSASTESRTRQVLESQTAATNDIRTTASSTKTQAEVKTSVFPISRRSSLSTSKESGGLVPSSTSSPDESSTGGVTKIHLRYVLAESSDDAAKSSRTVAADSGKSLQCNRCAYRYVDTEGLRQHLLQDHGDTYTDIPGLQCGVKQYECLHCSFRSKGSLQIACLPVYEWIDLISKNKCRGSKSLIFI